MWSGLGMATSSVALSNSLASVACSSTGHAPPPGISSSVNLPTSQLFGVKLHAPSITSSSRLATQHFLQQTVCKVSKGDVAPPFTLKDQDGKSVSLSKFKGKPVVLYFYPADETPGCTKQACAFRDSYEKFKKAGAVVIGVSGDSSESHKNFAKKYRLPFTLLSDEGNKLRKEWGIPGDFFGSLPGRQTYVIDKKGVVQLIFNNQFQPEKHIDETLKILQSI
ncbi:hypothetical protein KP509_06G075000 [Ceratopteris richardii]|uniref:thioredoxin-dependent peroxiredoxin n=1 Tax=Ceratopteris richardii TaxID=49495 RepID=A0A8T2UUA1_CERRI|nr:hypothetical protein KP509_06G075000 [Ceratopteris richardii]